MDARQQRGIEIATTLRVRRQGGQRWLVPSQRGTDEYVVDFEEHQPMCSCPDFELRRCKCKHIYAVEHTIETQRNLDGSTTVTETVTTTRTIRKTYRQVWPAYNAAQTSEKRLFQILLSELCRTIRETEPPSILGRPRAPLSDVIFSAAFKIFSTISGRRFQTDLREACDRGYVGRVLHYNTIFKYLEDARLTPILKQLITLSSLPLKSVETDFAVDSSGFSTSRFVRWFDHKYGVERLEHDWVKVHLMCGVKTNVVTSVEIAGRDANDCPMLRPLAKATAKHFTMREVSGDKAFSSKANVDLILGFGAMPYIPFKSNATGAGGSVWEKLYHFYNLQRDKFLSHYHKRSNIESTFSMIKAKFRDHVRSKTDIAMVNEVLCKVLCHNLCCLIQSIFEFGIDVTFGEQVSKTVSAIASVTGLDEMQAWAWV